MSSSCELSNPPREKLGCLLFKLVFGACGDGCFEDRPSKQFFQGRYDVHPDRRQRGRWKELGIELFRPPSCFSCFERARSGGGATTRQREN